MTDQSFCLAFAASPTVAARREWLVRFDTVPIDRIGEGDALSLRMHGFRLFLASALAAAPVSGQEARDTLHVFFVGNSYIYFNNLPGVVEGISQALDGPYVNTASHTRWAGLGTRSEARS